VKGPSFSTFHQEKKGRKRKEEKEGFAPLGVLPPFISNPLLSVPKKGRRVERERGGREGKRGKEKVNEPRLIPINRLPVPSSKREEKKKKERKENTDRVRNQQARHLRLRKERKERRRKKGEEVKDGRLPSGPHPLTTTKPSYSHKKKKRKKKRKKGRERED